MLFMHFHTFLDFFSVFGLPVFSSRRSFLTFVIDDLIRLPLFSVPAAFSSLPGFCFQELLRSGVSFDASNIAEAPLIVNLFFY